jgi:hypothetical protein
MGAIAVGTGPVMALPLLDGRRHCSIAEGLLASGLIRRSGEQQLSTDPAMATMNPYVEANQ